MDFSNINLSIISSFYFDQRSATPLFALIDHYSKYSKDVLRQVQFIFVDDGSKVQVDIPADIGLNFQYFRIKDDIPWNNAGGRNLGATFARSSKIILTDIDHVYPENLLSKVLKHKARRSVFYKFKRASASGEKMRTPRNLLYMTKAVFFDCLGYDEAFSNHYGFEDSFLIELLQAKGNSFRYFSRFSKVIELAVDRETSYHSYDRDTSINLKLYEQKKHVMKKHDALESHSRLFLNFSWEKVNERINVV